MDAHLLLKGEIHDGHLGRHRINNLSSLAYLAGTIPLVDSFRVIKPISQACPWEPDETTGSRHSIDFHWFFMTRT